MNVARNTCSMRCGWAPERFCRCDVWWWVLRVVCRAPPVSLWFICLVEKSPVLAVCYELLQWANQTHPNMRLKVLVSRQGLPGWKQDRRSVVRMQWPRIGRGTLKTVLLMRRCPRLGAIKIGFHYWTITTNCAKAVDCSRANRPEAVGCTAISRRPEVVQLLKLGSFVRLSSDWWRRHLFVLLRHYAN